MTRCISRIPVLLLGLLGMWPVLNGEAHAQRGRTGDDTVLRLMTSGTQAISANDWSQAEARLEVAAREILLIWGPSVESQRARALWYEERVKPFKGEPYERMMALYYLGLVYLQKRDFGNAQAAFRNSVMQDSFAEEEQFQSDAALPLFLQGWALQAQGSLSEAANAYRALTTLRPDFETPDLESSQPNVLVVWETGTAPRKVNDGIGGYKLRYFRGREFTEQRVLFGVNGSTMSEAYPMEDVYWQAATRGARPVDFILEGKAQFAASTGSIGSGLSDLSNALVENSMFTGSRVESNIGTALGLAGVVALTLSSRARPAADVRSWDNLPDLVHVAMMHLPPGDHLLETRFADRDGNLVDGLEKTIPIVVPEGDLTPQLVWISSRPRSSRYLERNPR
jgi:tetratricopeptide (TPR) repeat protein